MRVKTISYRRTVQTRQYESATLEITVELNEGEDDVVALRELKAHVEANVKP